MPAALAGVVENVDATVVVLSYNDESWLTLDELVEMCSVRGAVEVLAFDSARYVGARIGTSLPTDVVQRLFGVLLLVVGAKLLLSA